MKVQKEFFAMIRALLLAYLMTGVFLLLIAFLLWQMEPKESMISAGIQVIYVLGSFIGGFAAGKGIRKKRLFWGMLSGVLYYVFLLLASWCTGGITSTPGHLWITFVLCLGGGITGGILS